MTAGMYRGCLLSDSRQLVESTKLVYNDSPTFYERVPDSSKLQVLIDLRKCGVRNKLAEETIELLPDVLRPTLLTSLVVETVNEGHAKVKEGLAKELEDKIRSEEFHKAVVRLVKHHELSGTKQGARFTEEDINERVGRLSIIHIYAVRDMKTQLQYKSKAIEDSETCKTCHVTSHVTAAHETVWEVYVELNAGLNHELLIPLSQVINTILGGMLNEAVLFLIPLLTSQAGQMNRALNKLNIKEDNSSVSEPRIQLYPTLGEPVTEAHRRLMSDEAREFKPGEWAGYQASEEQGMVYCQVQEEVLGDGVARCFLVKSTPTEDIEIARWAQLFAFITPK